MRRHENHRRIPLAPFTFCNLVAYPAKIDRGLWLYGAWLREGRTRGRLLRAYPASAACAACTPAGLGDDPDRIDRRPCNLAWRIRTVGQCADGDCVTCRYCHRPSSERLQFDQVTGCNERRCPFRSAGLRNGPALSGMSGGVGTWRSWAAFNRYVSYASSPNPDSIAPHQ